MALDAKAPPEIETAVAALTRIRADAQTVREAARRLPPSPADAAPREISESTNSPLPMSGKQKLF